MSASPTPPRSTPWHALAVDGGAGGRSWTMEGVWMVARIVRVICCARMARGVGWGIPGGNLNSTPKPFGDNSPPYIIGSSLIAKTICIPRDMSDVDVLAWTENHEPAGTTYGWELTEKPENIDARYGGGSPQRCQCPDFAGRVHVRVNV